jgi:hypothetical protein
MYCSAMMTRLLVGILTPAIRATLASPLAGRPEGRPKIQPLATGPSVNADNGAGHPSRLTGTAHLKNPEL